VKLPVVNERELAEVFNVHRHTVSEWVKSGLPLARGRGPRGAHRIGLAVACRWVLARYQAAVEDARSSPEVEAARNRKLTAEARIAEANADEREGRSIPADQLSERWGRMTLAMKEGVLAVAATAVQLGIVSPEKEQALAQLHHDVLRHLAERGKS
jgi:hypothetical protein